MIGTALNNILDLQKNTEISETKINISKFLNSDDKINSEQINSKSKSPLATKSNSESPVSQLQVENFKQPSNLSLEENLINSSLNLTEQIKKGQLFGPFTDPIKWLAIRNSSTKSEFIKEFCPLEPELVNLFFSIQIANSPKDQNIEIIVKNNKFYFRSMKDIDLENSEEKSDEDEIKNSYQNNQKEKLSDEESSNSKLKTNLIKNNKEKPLFAWFNSELSSRLPSPLVSTINGDVRYYCIKCNKIFIHPNPATLHFLFSCSRIQNIEEQLSPPSGKPENNSSLVINSNFLPSNNLSVVPQTQDSELNLHSPLNLQLTTSSKTPPFTTTSINGNNKIVQSPVPSLPNNSISSPNLNEKISISNSKILKNLEAKLCKQYMANITNDTMLPKQNNQFKPNKPKKRAFDIDSLVNGNSNNKESLSQKSLNDQQNLVNNLSSKKIKNDFLNDFKNKNNLKNDKSNLNKSLNVSSKVNENLNNSTLINTLNSPLINANLSSSLSSPFLNPFSLLDPALANNLPSAFHKLDSAFSLNKNLASNSSSSLINSTQSNSINSLSNTLTDQTSLLNAAAMFNPSFANPFDFASFYAQQQRNLLQSMFPNPSSLNSNSQSLISNPSSILNAASAQSYLQNQLSSTNNLIASQNLANLNSLSNFNNFNGLNSLLASSNPNTAAALSSLTSGLPSTLANTLFGSGLSGTNSVDFTSNSNNLANFKQQNLDHYSINQTDKTNNNLKKKKNKEKEKDLTNNNLKLNNQLNQSINVNNNRNISNNPLLNDSKLAASLQPSYLNFLPPSLAALSFPQSNWCAKCNISFRMTSDLVYHMRSQHKDTNTNLNDNSYSSDSMKRKKEENKLFCQICGEGFKERHHLTRHMTSHN